MSYEDELKAFADSVNKGSNFKTEDITSEGSKRVANFDALKSTPVNKIESHQAFTSKGIPILPKNPNASKSPFKPSAQEIAKSDISELTNSVLIDGKDPIFLLGPISGPGLGNVNIDTSKYNYWKWSMEEEDPKKGWFKNLPMSVTKLPGRFIIGMFYDYPKGVLDEFTRQMEFEKSKEFMTMDPARRATMMTRHGENQFRNISKPIEDILHAMMTSLGVYDTVMDTINGETIYIEKTPVEGSEFGIKNKTNVVFKLPTYDKMKELWNKDPFGTAALYAPFFIHGLAKSAAKRAKTKAEADNLNAVAEDALKKAREARAEGENLTKIKNESIARQVDVAKDEGFLDEEGFVAPQGEVKVDITGEVTEQKPLSRRKKKAERQKSSVQKLNKEEAKPPIEEPTPVTPEERVDNIVNNETDKATGIKKKERIKPLKNPEESEFFQDAQTTADKTEVFKGFLEEMKEDPDMYLEHLINEVNRWYHGHEGADINLVRRKLTELSSKIDILKDDFRELDTEALQGMLEETTKNIEDVTRDYDFSERFEDFKATVHRASQWAKRLQPKSKVSETVRRSLDEKPLEERLQEFLEDDTGKVEVPEEMEYGTVSDIKFYSGLPLDKIKALLMGADFKRLYHGTKSDFDAFDNRLLTGEGANAFGAGTYLTEGKRIGIDYAKRLGRGKDRYGIDNYQKFKLDGKEYIPANPDIANELHRFLEEGGKKEDVLNYIKEQQALNDHFINEHKQIDTGSEWSKTEIKSLQESSKYYQKDYDAIANADVVESSETKPTLYTVRLKKGFQNMNWLDWESEVPKNVRELVNKYVDFSGTKRFNSPMTGREAYEYIARATGDPLKASKVLNDIGVDGIRYNAGSLSGGVKPFTKNFVVFDKDQLVIERKTRSHNPNMLYSGADVSGHIGKIAKYFSGVRAAKEASFEKQQSSRPKKFLRDAARKFLSQSANLKRGLIDEHGESGGYDVLQSLNLNISSTSRSAALADQLKKEIISGLSDIQREALNEVIFAKRTRTIIDRDEFKKRTDPSYKAHKNPLGLSREDWQDYIDSIGELKGLTKEDTMEVYRRSDMLFEAARDQLRQLYEEGLITKEVFEDLKNLDYQRRQMIDIVDPQQTLGNKKIDIRESGIQELSIGSEKQFLETDSIRLLEDLIIRTQNRIFANKAAKDLYAMAEANPESPIARLKRPDSGWEAVHCFIDGEKKPIYMPKEFADEWITKNKEISYEIGKFARLISGSSIVRTLATGINVGFALKNFFRDFAYMWVASQHYVKGAGWTSTYSSFAPKAIGQMASDIRAVYKDVFFKKGIYQEMVDNGVLLDFLSGKDRILKDRIGKVGNKHVQAISDALHWPSNYSELIGRAALYNRAKRKGLSNKEAAFLSRDYLFFGDYGSWTKAIDTVVPYFGATIKATEGIYRAAARNPSEFGLKSAQALSFGATLYLLNRTINKEAYDQLSENDRKNNFIIPFAIPYEGTDGKRHHLYPKVPKDPYQALLCMAGENAMKYMIGDETDSDKLAAIIQSLSPIQGMPSVPSIEALYSYISNKDFYRYDDIWHGPDVAEADAGAEIIPSGPRKTHPISKTVGEVTGMSPVRLERALRVIVPRNYLTDAFSSMTRTIFDRAPDDIREGVVAEILGTDPTFRNFLATTDDMNGMRDQMDEMEARTNVERVMHNGKIDSLIEQINNGEATAESLSDYIGTMTDPNEAERLWKRAENRKEEVKLPHLSFWKRIGVMEPEDAAKSMFRMMKRMESDEERAKLLDEFVVYDDLHGLGSERFLDEYSRLDEEWKMKIGGANVQE